MVKSLALSLHPVNRLFNALSAARSNRHRHFIHLDGEREPTEKIVNDFINLAEISEAIIITSPLQEQNQIRQYLGRDSELFVYYAHSGFDPNLFAAVAATVSGGGLILLLTPPLDQWALSPNPIHRRILVHPHSEDDLDNRYLKRLTIQLNRSNIESISAKSIAPLQSTIKPTEITAIPDTLEQAELIKRISRHLEEKKPHPILLTAERGRGKSAALGIIAAQLLKDGLRIVITAAHKKMLVNLYRHLNITLEKLSSEESPADNITFIAPDQILRQHPKFDLLIVDEAAALPISMLTQLINEQPHALLASTVHGYEGSGMGFLHRFTKVLDRKTPGWLALNLTTPIRWSLDDPAEKQINRLLLLDADTESVIKTDVIDIDNLQWQRLNRDELIINEQKLRQIYSLLVSAHYQTTPFDLYQILDGPNIQLYSLENDQQLLGVIVAAEEGQLKSDLCREILYGRRRPKGHLLPQTLIAHQGLDEAGGARYLRIIRIAVEPHYQRRRLGSHMLTQLREELKGEGYDLFGASCGATESLLIFWITNGFNPHYIGQQRGLSSGSYAVNLLSALSSRGSDILRRAKRQFSRHLQIHLQRNLCDLEAEITAILLAECDLNTAIDLNDYFRDIHLFSEGERQPETVIASLQQAAQHLLSGPLPDTDRVLLNGYLFQNRPFHDIEGCHGKREGTQRLRKLFFDYLSQFRKP